MPDRFNVENTMKIKIGFEESSKAVTAHVTIEEDITEVSKSLNTLEVTKQLFIEAQKFAQQQTMKKL
jgi:hypothetical protein